MKNKVYLIDEKTQYASGIVKAIDLENPNLKLCAKITSLKDENKVDQDREREVLQILSTIDQRNIVKIYQVDEKDQKQYIIMEKCDMNLTQYITKLKEQGKLTIETFISIVQSVSAGYEILHSKMILHRDIKPDNILVNLNSIGLPTFKIADFDISMVASPDKLKTFNSKGTAQTKAPEIMQNSEYSYQADIFAFGISLLQLFNSQINSKKKKLLLDRLEKKQSLLAIKNSSEEKDIQLIQQLQLNNCNQTVLQFLNQMLYYNPEQRGDWEQLSKICINIRVQLKDEINDPILFKQNFQQFKQGQIVQQWYRPSQGNFKFIQPENPQQTQQNYQEQIKMLQFAEAPKFKQIPDSAKPFSKTIDNNPEPWQPQKIISKNPSSQALINLLGTKHNNICPKPFQKTLQQQSFQGQAQGPIQILPQQVKGPSQPNQFKLFG